MVAQIDTGPPPAVGSSASIASLTPFPENAPVPVSVKTILLPTNAATPTAAQYDVLWSNTSVASGTPSPAPTDLLQPPLTMTFNAVASLDFTLSNSQLIGSGRRFSVVQINTAVPSSSTSSSATSFGTLSATNSSGVVSSSSAAVNLVSAPLTTVIRTWYASFDIATLSTDIARNTSKWHHYTNIWSTTGANTKVTLFATSPGSSPATTTGHQKRQTPIPSLGGGFLEIEPWQSVTASKDGISSGAGAGIGIGCAILGGLVGLAVAFCLFRGKRSGRSRRSDQHHSKSPSRGYESYSMAESKIPAAASTVTIPHDSAAATVFNNKPQPKEDNTISDEFSRLKSRIDGHVNTYYLRSGGAENVALDALAQIWTTQSPMPLSRLPSLLADSRSRLHVLRAAIAWLISERIVPSAAALESFLPVDIAGTYADLCNNRMDVQTRSAFLSEWRVMTTALSGSLYGQEALNIEDPRLTNIRAALRQADMFLLPLANNAEHEARLHNLEEIMKRAARLGWTLFSQPSEFHIDWADENRGIVVFPGLLQVTDENGKVIRHPRSFGQKETVPMKK